MYRLFKNVATPHMLWGGATVLTYQLVLDFMTHHNHTSNRPAFIDHTLAMTILGAGAGAMTGKGGPTRMFTGAFFAFSTLAPLTWWVAMQGLLPGSARKPANIFYEDGVTKEEVARFQHMDQIENLAHNMQARPGYGYERLNMRFDN